MLLAAQQIRNLNLLKKIQPYEYISLEFNVIVNYYKIMYNFLVFAES